MSIERPCFDLASNVVLEDKIKTGNTTSWQNNRLVRRNISLVVMIFGNEKNYSKNLYTQIPFMKILLFANNLNPFE